MAHNDHQDEMIHQIWKMSGEKYVDVFVLTKYVTSGQRLCRANDITNVHNIKQLFLVTKAFSTKYKFIFQFFASLHLNPKQKDTWKLEYLDLHIPELLPLFTKQTNKKIIER